LARQFSKEAHGEQKMKALWWLTGLMGQHNNYSGKVYEYGPIWGSGAAVVGLTPSEKSANAREYDESEVETFSKGDDVLGKGSSEENQETSRNTSNIIHASSAPKPVGAYPHARKIGDLLYLSGVGPRTPGTDEIPGGAIQDSKGVPQEYSIEKQTQAVIENIKLILEESGSSLEKVRDITVFLVNMKEDFSGFNKIYNGIFDKISPTRTTLEVGALPTPIAVEFKVIAEC